jgi:tRNA threonylcarbamoyladenosine biosynthesis protein TsaB
MNVRCLAIEASTDQLAIAAGDGIKMAEWQTRPARAESQRIFTHAIRLLEGIGLDLPSLECVAFGCGPGSFTGVRLAAAAAQSLAFALSIPVCRRSSLAVMAAGAMRQYSAKVVGVCLDAHMGRAYFGLYRDGGNGNPVPLVEDRVIDPANFSPEPVASMLAVGSGWDRYPSLKSVCSHIIAGTDAGFMPAAGDLLKMAITDFRSGATVRAEDALPDYLGHGPVAAGLATS